MSLSRWLKVAVSAALILYLAVLVGPGRVVEALGRASLGWVAAGAALWWVIQMLNVFKWRLLTRAQGLPTPFAQLCDMYFVGMFFNMFLPGGFGGDAMRAYQLSERSGQTGSSLASVIVDRFTSLYALLLTATAALAAAPADGRLMPPGIIAGLDVAGALGFVLLVRSDWLRRVAGSALLARWPRLCGLVGETAGQLAAFRSAGRVVAVALGLSVVYQALAVVLHAMLMTSLGMAVPFSYVAAFVPLLSLAASLPISINGLGVREGGYSFFLARWGIAPAEAVSVGLLSLSMLMLSAAWGAVCFARSRRAVPEVCHERVG